MPKSGDLVPVQTYLKPELVARIDALAKRLQRSRSTTLAQLLETAVDDNERIIQAVTHPRVLALIRSMSRIGKAGGSPGKVRSSEA